MKQIGYLFVVALFLLFSNTVFAQPPQPLEGQALIDSLLNELPKQKEDTNKVVVLDDLSNAYCDIDDEQAIKYGKAELKLATKLNYKPGMAWACNNLGSLYRSKSEYDVALQYFTQGLKLNQEIGDAKGIAGVTCNIGNVYNSQGNYPKALEYLLEALNLAEKDNYTQYTANITCNLGSIYATQENYEKSQEYTLKALKIFEDMDYKIGIAATTCNVGNNHQSMNEHEKALEYFLKALKLDEEGGYKHFSAIVSNSIGKNYKLQQNYPLATEYFRKSLEISEEIGDKASAARALADMGITCNEIIKQGVAYAGASRSELLKKATEHLQRGLQISKDIDAPDIMKRCYLGLATSYRLNGNFNKALEATDNYHAIKDSLFSKDNTKKMLRQQMTYDFGKREDSIKVANAMREKESAIRYIRQRNYTYMGVGGALLLVLFSVFMLRSNKLLGREKKRSDDLLLNILPAEVAAELKEKGNAEAKLINEVTVLFTDFKGFTLLSEKLSPKELIAEINECFSAFDRIMLKHGVEKIKTIGDAYMAAGGLPTPNKTHATDVVNAAIEIQQYMLEHKKQKEANGELFFEIRIGVHTGPVVAGIVGIKKFAYDIWGDTVNTASRMESSGQAGAINISQTTYDLVKDKFNCEYRGEIDAKNKGKLKMYFVK